jgi:hypothetical protein
MKRQCRHKQSGMTLVLVTAIGVIAGILAMSMIDLGYQARMLSVRNVQGITARAAADAGLADAVFWMQKKLIRQVQFTTSEFPRTISGTLPGTTATYSYTIAKLDQGYHRYQIDSTGTMAGRSKTVHAILRVGSLWKGVGVLTTFDAKYGVNLLNDCEIRTNSTTGGSQGQITLKNGVVVPGDVIIGPGGDIDKVLDVKSGTILQGDVYAAEDPLLFPPVAAPTPALDMTPITKSTIISTSGTYHYPSISLPNSGQLVIAAPNVKIYVTGAITMKNSAQVVVQAGASLNLYLGGNLECKNSTGFSNLTNDPTGLRIFGLPGCTQMDFKNSSICYAALYAPNAQIDMYNSATFYGAICAESVYMKNSATIGFDPRVAALLIEDPAAVFETERWWED